MIERRGEREKERKEERKKERKKKYDSIVFYFSLELKIIKRTCEII
jgi:hypothetical protein